MGYRVLVSGVPIECDSIDEAVALARRAGGETQSGPARTEKVFGAPNEGSRWTEGRVKEFLKLVQGLQLKVLSALREYPDGRTDEQLLQLLGLEGGKALGGVLASLWKNAKKVGANPEDLYSKDAVVIAGKELREYKLTEGFRRAVENAGVKF